MGQALHQIAAASGSGFVLTLAPQTIEMQSTGMAYFQLALNVRDTRTPWRRRSTGCRNGVQGWGGQASPHPASRAAL
jgi:hypothetical protein